MHRCFSFIILCTVYFLHLHRICNYSQQPYIASLTDQMKGCVTWIVFKFHRNKTLFVFQQRLDKLVVFVQDSMVYSTQAVLVGEPDLCCLIQTEQWVQQSGRSHYISLRTCFDKRFISHYLLIPEWIPRLSCELACPSSRYCLKSSRWDSILVEVRRWICWLEIRLEVVNADVLASVNFKQHLQLIRV